MSDGKAEGARLPEWHRHAVHPPQKGSIRVKTDVEWKSNGLRIAGHLYLPDTEGPAPGIVLCHGFAGVKELLLPAYAERFCAAGYAVVTFDYRGFGESDGEPGRLVPEHQIEDILSAVSFLAEHPKVDANRIGLWGTSLGGANAVVAASRDDRVKCLAVQLTFANGERVVTGGMSEDEAEKFKSTLSRMQAKRAETGREMMVPLKKILTDTQSAAFYDKYVGEFPALSIRVPFLTVAETLAHKPEDALPNLRVPLLVIGAGQDSVNPPEESLKLFEKAMPPKEFLMLEDATHYELYEGPHLDTVSARQIAWFGTHLATAS